MEYKVILFGDKNVGKTSWLKRVLTAQFVSKYTPTLGAEVFRFILNTNQGEIKLNVWDIGGDAKLSGKERCITIKRMLVLRCMIYLILIKREFYPYVRKL